ncbi:hypothetical protein HYU17_05335 [Candidatus Woesearchaeota archaeon]|nr:hypothetical protein [Candidatus Woesearchaeota archaeon]
MEFLPVNFSGALNNRRLGASLSLIHSFLSSVSSLIKKHKVLSGLVCTSLLLAVFKPVFFVLTIFIVLGALSTVYKIAFNVGFDFELQSFFTVAAGNLFGPKAGIIVGLLSVLLGHSINFMLFRNALLSGIYAISFALLGLLAAVVPLNYLVMAGTAYVFANDVLFIFLGTMFGAPTGKLLLAAIVHPFLVYFLLSKILMPLLNLFGGKSI